MTLGVGLVISAICIGHVGLSYHLMKEARMIGDYRQPWDDVNSKTLFSDDDSFKRYKEMSEDHQLSVKI